MPLAISQVADLFTAISTPTGALAFTLSGIVGTVTLTGVSYHPTVVPSGNIVFGGSGASRTVTITPATGRSGAVTILVRAVDDADGIPVEMTFLLTVLIATAGWTVPASWVSQQIAPTVEEDSQGVKGTVVYHAPYPACATPPARPVYGETLSTVAGMVVGGVKVEALSGETSPGANDGVAMVTITLIPPEKSERGTSEGEPAVVSYRRRWENLQKSIYDAAIYLPSGSKALTEEDIVDIENWKNEPQRALKKLWKYRREGAATVTLSANAQHAAAKILRRNEDFTIAYPVVSRVGRSRASLTSADVMNRTYDAPPGFPRGTFPTGWKWVGIEDDLEQFGVTGPREGTVSFRGVSEADSDFYPSAVTP